MTSITINIDESFSIW